MSLQAGHYPAWLKFGQHNPNPQFCSQNLHWGQRDEAHSVTKRIKEAPAKLGSDSIHCAPREDGEKSGIRQNIQSDDGCGTLSTAYRVPFCVFQVSYDSLKSYGSVLLGSSHTGLSFICLWAALPFPEAPPTLPHHHSCLFTLCLPSQAADSGEGRKGTCSILSPRRWAGHSPLPSMRSKNNRVTAHFKWEEEQ